MNTPDRVAGFTWEATPTANGLEVAAVTPAGEHAAKGTLSFRTLAAGEHRASLEGSVAEGHRRKGLGTSMLRWAESTALSHYAPNLQAGELVHFRADADAPDVDAISVFQSAGLELAVAEDQLERPLTSIPATGMPEDMCVLGWGPMTVPLFFHAYDSSFRERPGFPGWDEARWRTTYTALDIFAPDLSMLVMDGPEPAAYAVVGIEDDAGWIFQLGVRPGWRGKGLGEAILARAMRSFAERGLNKAALEVATNNTYARALYDRLGFEPTHQWRSWQKQL